MSPIESISIPEASQAAPPLNCEERIRLAQLETLIEGSLEKFLLARRALLEIKTRRLHRQEYSTFQDHNASHKMTSRFAVIAKVQLKRGASRSIPSKG